MRRRRGLILLLSMILSAVMMPESTGAELLRMSLGVTVIENGAGVWFGQYNDTPILWRVLADGSDTRLPVSGKGEALLFSADILDYVPFVNQDEGEYYENDWQGSNAQAWCTNLWNSLPDESAEKAAINRTSVTETNDMPIVDTQDGAIYLEDSYCYLGGRFDDYYCAASLDNEPFFFLSAQDRKSVV